jgi:hypothetical protein
MRAPRLVALALSIALASFASTACRSAGPYDPDRQQSGAVMLVVRNDNFSDVDVYAIADGLATRVGTVTGNTTARFALSPTMVAASDLRIVATPIGGNGRASSGPLLVSPGQTIQFNIAPALRQSSAVVR